MNRFEYSSPVAISFLLGISLLLGCDRERASHPGTDSAVVQGGGKRAAVPADTTGFEPIDPATGHLQAVATGAVQGSWTFDDVNGSISESARGGATVATLQLEAHKDPPGVHIRLRMSRTDEGLDQGRYAIGSTDRALDAAFEYQNRFFRSVGDAKGSVQLTKVTNDRAVGTYEVTLEDLTPARAKQTISGSFDMRIQR